MDIHVQIAFEAADLEAGADEVAQWSITPGARVVALTGNAVYEGTLPVAATDGSVTFTEPEPEPEPAGPDSD